MEVKETSQETTPTVTGPSKKQQFAAVALTTVATVVLTMGANYVIDQVAGRVKDLVIKPKKENSN